MRCRPQWFQSQPARPSCHLPEATVDPVGARDHAGSPERFGFEWQSYDALLPIYEEQFRRWTPGIPLQQWQGKTFLDAGCGMGRNSYWPMTYGAAGGVALDLDDRSLASAAKTLQAYPGVRICKASIYDIGYDQAFDIAFSIGVIHHLKDPKLAMAQLVKAVRPGGMVAIWVYGAENNRWLTSFLNPTRHLLFSRLPVAMVHHLALYPTALLWLALRLGLQPIEYLRLIRGFGFAHLRSIVFDQMLPRIAHYWTKAEVEALMTGVGLQDVRLEWVNEMSWAATGRTHGVSS